MCSLTLCTGLMFSSTPALADDAKVLSNDVKITSDKAEDPIRYFYGVTEEMCTPQYWSKLARSNPDAVMLNAKQINDINSRLLGNPKTNMNDLENMKSDYNADSLREGLAAEPIPNKELYVD